MLLIIALLLWLLLMLVPQNYLLITNTISNIALVVFIIELGLSNPLITWPDWDISYGTYLWGYAISGCFMYQHKISFAYPLMEAWLIIIATLTIAFLSWFLIENPFLHKKELLK